MLSESNSSISVKNEELGVGDLSPISENKVVKEATWFVYNNKKVNLSSSLLNSSKKNIKSGDTPSKRWGHSSIIYNNSMILFGGRHSHRSLANIYSFDFNHFQWNKIEPLGQTPPARDSHSAIVYKNELIVFGGSGSGKKLNDLWVFNLDTKKWSKMNATGDYPFPREGHSCAIIRNTYMMIYGGLDENDENISNMYLLDLRNNIWHKVNPKGDEPMTRDSQSCSQVNNTCYIFGGQGIGENENEKLFNDMYTLSFDINETDKKFYGVWALEEVTGPKPPPRASHSSTPYKSQFIIIVGGEGCNQDKEKEPLNDVWIYNVLLKSWNQVIINNLNVFEARLCHSSSLFGERIYIYGGMKSADATLDSLNILCLDGKSDDIEEIANFSNSINNFSSNNNNNVALKSQEENFNKNYEGIKSFLKDEDECIFVSNNLYSVSTKNGYSENGKKIHTKDIGIDTIDLMEDNSFDFESLKKNYLNNMISWSFLKKLSDFNQWPLGCIGNFIENSLKVEINTKNIHIDVKCYDRKVYSNNSEIQNKHLGEISDFNEKILVLSIKDDGIGICPKEFNKIFYSFSINEKKEYNYFKFGISLKTSAVRLGNALLIISKTETEINLGLISKNLQTKLDTDFMLTPIVNFKINDIFPSENKQNGGKYIPKSNFSQQSLNLILNEIKFMFRDSECLYSYFDTINTGTHLFLFDLKQISVNKRYLNQLKNYELFFDYTSSDILFNYFDIQIGERNFVDCSLKTYLRFFCLKHPIGVNIYLYENKLNFTNPMQTIYNISKNSSESIKIHTNLKCDISTKTDCTYIEGELYKGVIFNANYLKIMNNSHNFENSFNEKEILNGILLYRDNRLISRFEQNKFGDISYFVKKYEKFKSKGVEEIINFFPISGYIELPNSCYEILYNKSVNYFYKL